MKSVISHFLYKSRVNISSITLNLLWACCCIGCAIHTCDAEVMQQPVCACWISLQIVSVCMFFYRVEVQAAGGQIWMTTSHISVTVSRDETCVAFSVIVDCAVLVICVKSAETSDFIPLKLQSNVYC